MQTEPDDALDPNDYITEVPRTPAEAFTAVCGWGSYMNGADPGACMYGFPLDDGRPRNEVHRLRCLEWLRRPGPWHARAALERRLLCLWFEYAPLPDA
jgi:hypothetical protein